MEAKKKPNNLPLPACKNGGAMNLALRKLFTIFKRHRFSNQEALITISAAYANILGKQPTDEEKEHVRTEFIRLTKLHDPLVGPKIIVPGAAGGL